jgi:hypothetical protein
MDIIDLAFLLVIFIVVAIAVIYQKYFSRKFSSNDCLKTLVDLQNLNFSTGVKLVNALESIINTNNCPKHLLVWKPILEEFGIKIGVLKNIAPEVRNFLTSQETRNFLITKYWQSYLARGIAPSLKLQEEFSAYKQQANLENYKSINLGENIIALFDYMLATDQEMKELEAEKLLKPIIDSAKLFILKFKNTSKKTRLLISASSIWFCYVAFRSNGDSEFLGMYLEGWSNDNFFFNFFGPISIWIIFSFLYKWIKSGK